MAKRKRKRNHTPRENENAGKLKPIVLGTMAAMLFTMVAVLLFALVIKLTGLGDEVIPPVNQAIKMSAIGLAALVAAKRAKDATLLCGTLAGVSYVLVGFLVFSLVGGSFCFDVNLLSDMLMGLISAAIVTLLIGRLRKKTA